jgi:hypothetical protein
MMAVTRGLEHRAVVNANYYMGIGAYDTATGYQAEVVIWGNEVDHWLAQYHSSGC